jgi:hypothetical protein
MFRLSIIITTYLIEDKKITVLLGRTVTGI